MLLRNRNFQQTKFNDFVSFGAISNGLLDIIRPSYSSYLFSRVTAWLYTSWILESIFQRTCSPWHQLSEACHGAEADSQASHLSIVHVYSFGLFSGLQYDKENLNVGFLGGVNQITANRDSLARKAQFC